MPVVRKYRCSALDCKVVTKEKGKGLSHDLTGWAEVVHMPTGEFTYLCPTHSGELDHRGTIPLKRGCGFSGNGLNTLKIYYLG